MAITHDSKYEIQQNDYTAKTQTTTLNAILINIFNSKPIIDKELLLNHKQYHTHTFPIRSTHKINSYEVLRYDGWLFQFSHVFFLF